MKFPQSTRLDTTIVAALTLLAAWLRILHLGQPSLWWDEFITVGSSLRPLGEMLDVLKYLGPNDNGVELFPPLAHVITHWLVGLAKNDALMRLPGVLAGVALIPATWVLCRKPLGRLSAHAACLLLAVSVYHLHYSREVRPYSLFLLENVLALHFLHAALTEGRRRLLWAWGAAVAAMLYTSYMAATLVFAQAVFAAGFLARAWFHGDREQAVALGWRAALALFLAGAAYLPWAEGQLLVFKLLHDPGFKARFTLEFAQSMLKEFAAFPYRGEFPAGWLLAALGLGGLAVTQAGSSRRFAVLLAAWAFMPLAGIFLAKARMELSSRYLITVFYFLVVFAGHFLATAVNRLADRLARGGPPIAAMRLTAVFFLALLVSGPNLESLSEYYSRETSNYKFLVRSLLETRNDQDMVVFYSPRNQKLIYDWYGAEGPRPARNLDGPGYHRAILVVPDLAQALATVPSAVPRARIGDADILGLGIARTPLIPMVPDASGTFEYSDDFSGLRALEEARYLGNMTPSPRTKTLVRHDAGLPAKTVYAFRAAGGTAILSASLAVKVSVQLATDYPTDDSMSLSLRVPGKASERLALLDTDSFRSPDGKLVPANHERKRFRSLTLDLTDRLAGASSFEIELESPEFSRSGALELEEFRVNARLDGPASPRQSLPLALLDQLPLAPYSPGVTLTLSRALHAFSLDGSVARPDVGGPELLKAYLAEHPGDKPVRVLNYPDATPAVVLHDPALANPWLTLEPGRVKMIEIAVPGQRVVRSLKLAGALSDPVLRLGPLSLPVPVSCPAPARVTLSPGQRGELLFTPLFTRNEFDPSTFSSSPAGSVARNGDEDCLACQDDRDCSVEYAVRSGLPVNRLHITAFPRVFSDARSLVRTLVSLDNGPWREVNAYRGSQSGRWEGLKIPQYSLVLPDKPARDVRVRFVMSGKAQLWSAPDARMRLAFGLDGSSMAAPHVDNWPAPVSIDSPAPLDVLLLEQAQAFPDSLSRTR